MFKLSFSVLGTAGLLAFAPSPGLNGWTATLVAKDGSRIAGTGRVEMVGVGVLRASIEVQRAPARSAGIAWAIHAGTCERLGAAHGGMSAYPPLVTDFTGETFEVATLKLPLPAGEFSMVVHQTDDPNSAVAACGVLRQNAN